MFFTKFLMEENEKYFIKNKHPILIRKKTNKSSHEQEKTKQKNRENNFKYSSPLSQFIKLNQKRMRVVFLRNLLFLTLILTILAQSVQKDVLSWVQQADDNESKSFLKNNESQSRVMEDLKDTKVERIMQSSTLSFTQLIEIVDESGTILGIRLIGDDLFFSGNSVSDQSKHMRFNGLTFQGIFQFQGQSAPKFDVQFNLARQWFFEGKSQGEIAFFSGQDYSQNQILEGEKKENYLSYMDLQQDYLIANFLNENILFKWDGTKFETAQNFNINQESYGLKICNDGTIIASLFESVPPVGLLTLFKVYKNSSTSFTEDQSFSIDGRKYQLMATDDCSTVILTSIANQFGCIHVIIRDEQGKFEKYSSHQGDGSYYRSCIHPEGDFFVAPKTESAEVWMRNADDLDYSYYSEISGRFHSSCALNNELIVMGDFSGQVSIASFTIEEEILYPDYGLKTQFVISQPIPIYEGNRKILGIALSGEHLVGIEEYIQSKTFKKGSQSYQLNQTLTQSRFSSCLDVQSSLNLLVLGSYNRRAYVYKDEGAGFSFLDTINTNSQILTLDLNPEGRLLLGHMNGDLSKYQWDSSTFTPEGNFSSAGSRILGVKSCPNQQMVVLQEKWGWFYFVWVRNDGEEKFVKQLEELLDVHMAVSSKCEKVFISSSMQMTVKVFVQEKDQYTEFKTVAESFPLYGIAINPETDVFVVNRHSDESSAVYHYDQCTQDYQRVEVLQGDKDDYTVVVTESEIILGDQGGMIKAHTYNYKTEVCDPFGKKALSPITDLATVSHAGGRAITDMDISGDLVIASSSYSPIVFFQIPQIGPISTTVFDQSIFVSSVTIVSSLKTFAAGTFNKTVLVYIDSGSGYELNQTISTESQVTSVHATSDNRLLAGMMNGDLAEFASDGQSFSPVGANTSNSNSRVYGVKLCPEGVRIALMEEAGVFQLSVFSSDGTETLFLSELSEELIEPFLAASPDCSILAVSGVTMQKVQVFKKEDEGYSLLDTINVEVPLSKVSIESDGDILVVPSITSPESYVYQYQSCTEKYSRKQVLNSGAYDEATAVSNQFVLQGNSQGVITISQYSWIYDLTCESLADSFTPIPSKASNEERNVQKLINSPSEGSFPLTSFRYFPVVFLVSFTIIVGIILCLSKKCFKKSLIKEIPDTQNELNSVAI